MRELKKGALGMLVLHLLQKQPSYGYLLCERLRAESGGTLSFDEGAIYPLLHEYERRGLVAGYWESGDEERPESDTPDVTESGLMPRKGPRRRYYRLTDRGVAALDTSVTEWQTFAEAVGRVLGDGIGGLAGKLDPSFGG